MADNPERGTWATRFNQRATGPNVSGVTGAPTANDGAASLGMRFDTGQHYRKYGTGATQWVDTFVEQGINLPGDNGLLAWPFEPCAAQSTFTLATAGTVYVVKAHLPLGGTITNVLMPVTTGGGTLTAAQCFAGVYQAGALLGTSADQATAWAGTGIITVALTAPVVAPAGDVYIAAFFNGTTGPTLSCGVKTVLANIGLAATVSRFGTADTGRTTSLPATLGTIAASPNSFWMGLS